MRTRMRLGWLVVLCLVGFLGGCGGSSGGGSSVDGIPVNAIPDSSGPGTLSVQLVDAAMPGFQAIYVTVDHIDVHPQDGDWTTVLRPQKTVNLLELVNGVQEHLGLTELPAGPYTQLRLVLSDTPDDGRNLQGNLHPFGNYFIDDGGQIQPLKVPSGLQTGIKLVGGFTIASSQTTELVLDFDASRSVVIAGKSGKALLKPTIKVIASAATVCGKVTDNSAAPLPGTLVSAQTTGPIPAELSASRLVASSLTDTEGRYALFLNPGGYQMVAFRPVTDNVAFFPSCQPLTLDADQKLKGVNFTLDPAPFGTLAVSVNIDISDPTGDEHVVLSVRQAALDSCTLPVELATLNVTAGGPFDLPLPVGDYQLIASSEGFAPQEFTIAIKEGEVTPQEVVFTP